MQFALNLLRQVFKPNNSQDLDVLVKELLVLKVIGVECHRFNEGHYVFWDMVETLI